MQNMVNPYLIKPTTTITMQKDDIEEGKKVMAGQKKVMAGKKNEAETEAKKLCIFSM